jgi:hypothetical protein
MKFPELYRIVTDKNFKEELTFALVKKDFTYATDSHVLIKHLTSKLFDEEFIKSLPNQGIGLNHNILKAICNKNIYNVAFESQDIIFLVSKDARLYPEMQFILPDIISIRFPDYNKVLFDEENAQPLKRITINPGLLYKAVMAIDPEWPYLNMYFQTDEKAILIKPKICSDYFGAVGVIMPVNPE